jgi:hypothetical protein
MEWRILMIEKSKIEMEKEIEDLKEKIQMEKTVKESEVILNKEFKEHNKKLELYIETQSEIIQKYAAKIAKLEMYIQKLIS